MLALVPMVLGMPYMTMLTVFASDVLQVGGGGLGTADRVLGHRARWPARCGSRANAHRVRLGN